MARLITLFALLIALPAGAQSPDPSGKWLAERPEAGEPKNFELPEIDTVELDNGLKITFIPFGLAPKATISARIRTGNINEGENTWLADIAAELMSEGAGERTGEEIAIAAAEMGGDLEVGVDPHVTAFDMAVLSGHAPDAIALMGDVIQRPALPEDDMERVKANFIRNLSVALSQPRGQAASAFLGALYGDHPYGRVFPTEAQLRSYEIDDVRAYYEQNFGAERTHIYVAGRFDRDAAEAAIRESFGDWREGPAPLVAPPDPRMGPEVILVPRASAPQSTIYLGLPVFGPENEDAIPLEVTNALLGGSFSSRITQNIREDKGYTYSPTSQILYNYQDGYWRFRADVTTDVTGAALKEVFKEIERLGAKAPPKDEAARTRNYMAGIFVLKNASPWGLIDQIAFTDFHDLPGDWLENYVPRVLDVSAEDMRQTAAQRLQLDNMILVVVGDLDAIKPQLESLPRLSGAAFDIRDETGATAENEQDAQ